MGIARGPRSSTNHRSPTRQQDPQQWTPTIEVTSHQHREFWRESPRDFVDPTVLTIGTVREVRPMDRQDVERMIAVAKSGDDERPSNLLAREASE